MTKDLKLITIITIIIIFCCLISINREIPDELYIKMNEINNNQSLIGLSKEQVVELLGEPRYERTDSETKTLYKFFAGKIVKKSFFGGLNGQDYYELKVFFDEKGKVEYTYMKLST